MVLTFYAESGMKPNDIEGGSELTVEQGYRLKHEIEKAITYGPAPKRFPFLISTL